MLMILYESYTVLYVYVCMGSLSMLRLLHDISEMAGVSSASGCARPVSYFREEGF